MGQRLADALRELDCDVGVGPAPDPDAHINHWMSFAFAVGCPATLNTMFVTHADDPYKIGLIQKKLSGPIQMALCMSPHAREELIGFGIPANRLWYSLPALDAPVGPRRIRIGITTRVYDDGRKRESFLRRLAADLPLHRFHFDIYGSGWDSVIHSLEVAGAKISYDPGTENWQDDYARIRAAIPYFDYYLYLGMDEGSLGTLDAVTAGIKTIVTAQGFHLSIPGGITHPFTQYDELKAIFIALDRQSGDAVSILSAWNWGNYAREHVDIWNVLLRHSGEDVPLSELEATSVRMRRYSTSIDQGKANQIAPRSLKYYAKVLHLSRIRGAIARSSWMQPIRRLIGR